MTQIINRRNRPSQALGTLANNALVNLDVIYDGLTHKAFLFEYHAMGFMTLATLADMTTEDGVDIVLVRNNLSAGDIDTILTGAEITDRTQSTEVPERQQIFGLAKFVEVDNISGVTLWMWEVHFKPSAKGGIPFTEDSGWELNFINRSGSALSTGTIVTTKWIYERFAYEGGGGA